MNDGDIDRHANLGGRNSSGSGPCIGTHRDLMPAERGRGHNYPE